jgi:hypothetical protein
MPNTSYNTSSPAKQFPNVYIGTVMSVDSSNKVINLTSDTISAGPTGNAILTVDSANDNIYFTSTKLAAGPTGNAKLTLDTTPGNDIIKLKTNIIEIGKNLNNDTILGVNATENLLTLNQTRITKLSAGITGTDAVNYNQLQHQLQHTTKAISNLSQSLAIIAHSLYGNQLNNHPAKIPYTIDDIPSINVDNNGDSSISDITTSDVMELIV